MGILYTPNNALPYDDLSEAADAPAALARLAERLDSFSDFGKGTFAEMPPPGRTGRHYWASDGGPFGTGSEYLDIGTAWVDLGPSVVADGSIGTAKLADGAVTDAKVQPRGLTHASIAAQTIRGGGAPGEIAPETVTAGELAAALKPSEGAGGATEALRALGNGAGNAMAGNATPTPGDGTVTWAKLAGGLVGSAANTLAAGNDARLGDGAAALGTYRMIAERAALFSPGTGAAEYILGPAQETPVTGNPMPQGAMFFLDPGDFPNVPAGKSRWVRLVLEFADIGVPSNITFTAAIWRMNLGGSASSVFVRIGATALCSVAGGPNNVGGGHGRVVTADTAFPAASDMYAVTVTLSAAPPANSQPYIRCVVQGRVA